MSKGTIAPDKFSYTFKLQLTDTRGVSSTATQVDFQFDNGFGAEARVPAWGYSVGNEVFNAMLTVSLTDDNGNRVWASVDVADLEKL